VKALKKAIFEAVAKDYRVRIHFWKIADSIDLSIFPTRFECVFFSLAVVVVL
jgi:hypothetical protein